MCSSSLTLSTSALKQKLEYVSDFKQAEQIYDASEKMDSSAMRNYGSASPVSNLYSNVMSGLGSLVMGDVFVDNSPNRQAAGTCYLHAAFNAFKILHSKDVRVHEPAWCHVNGLGGYPGANAVRQDRNNQI